MYHSVIFGEKNTWDDWHLIPTSRPVINPPEPKINQVEIPGSDGSLDLTNALNPFVYFKNRTGSIEFMIVNDLYYLVRTHEEWFEVYSEIANYLHGQKMRMILEDDPDYFYEGRFKVNSFKSGKNYSTITIDYDVNPYKWSVVSTLDNPDYYYYNHISLPNSSGGSLFWVTVTINPNDLGMAPISPEMYVTFAPTTELMTPYLMVKVPGYEDEMIFDGTNLSTTPLKVPGLSFRKGMSSEELQYQVAADWQYGNGATMKLDFRKGVL